MDGTAFRLLGKSVMDVSTLPARSPTTAIAGDKGKTTAARPPAVVDTANLDKPAQKTSESATATPTGRALEVLRQEIRYVLAARLGVSLSARAPAFDSTPSADQVAAETLGAASRLLKDNPDIGTYALLKFRQRVESAATFTRQSFGQDGDIADVNQALAKVRSGLDALDEQASRNVESSASVLSVETRQRQRSTIRIRTQEGDVVRLDLRQSSRLSAQDIAVQNENGSASQTEIAVSSRSKLKLTVKGDLNEAEFAAIKNVFAQAESIADKFYNGNLSAAFSEASSLSFDAEQLARVNLRFRSREVVNTAYTQVTQRSATPLNDPANPPLPANPAPADPAPQNDVPAPTTPPAAKPVSRVERPEAPRPADPVTGQVAKPEPKGIEAPTPADIDLSNTPFLEFFELLVDFLRGVADSVEQEVDRYTDELADSQATAVTFNFSQSFKLEIFKSVLELTAPSEKADDAAELAGALIDGLSDVTEVEDDDD